MNASGSATLGHLFRAAAVVLLWVVLMGAAWINGWARATSEGTQRARLVCSETCGGREHVEAFGAGLCACRDSSPEPKSCAGQRARAAARGRGTPTQ